MNPLIDVIPARARRWVYAVYAVAGLVMGYAAAKGWVGPAEMVAFSGFGVLIGATAASNTGISPVDAPVSDSDGFSGEGGGLS